MKFLSSEIPSVICGFLYQLYSNFYYIFFQFGDSYVISYYLISNIVIFASFASACTLYSSG